MGLNKRLSQLVACVTLQRNFITQSTACQGRGRASEGSSTFLFFVANFKKRVREKTFPPPVVFLTNNAPQNLLCVSPHYARPLKRKKWKLVPGKGGQEWLRGCGPLPEWSLACSNEKSFLLYLETINQKFYFITIC